MPKDGVSLNRRRHMRRMREIYRQRLFLRPPPEVVEPTASTSRDILLPREAELPDDTLNISTQNISVVAAETAIAPKDNDPVLCGVKKEDVMEQSEEYDQQSTCSKFGEKSGEGTYPPEVNAAASASLEYQFEVFIKEEPADKELDLGAVMLEHMDCNYQPYKEEPLLD